MRAVVVAAFIAAIGLAALPYGSIELKLSLFPSPTMEAEFLFGGRIVGFTLESTSVLHWNTWVWQEFAARGAFGPFAAEGKVLFGPSTIDFVYDELILRTSFAGLELAFYSSQLSGAVLGGPASGAALEITGSFGDLGFKSITGFGATPEGIEIFHAPTGLSRRYITDPRPPGNGFTAQKLSLTGIPLPCAGCPDIAAEFYFTKAAGFDHLAFSVDELVIRCCPEISLAGKVTFELQTKSLTIEPSVSVEPACFIPYLELGWEDHTLTGLDLAAMELSCKFSNGILRSVTILKRCCWAISTPEYGSQVVRCFVADKEGIEYFTEYWEFISLDVHGEGCCGEWRATFNAYFGGDPSLFGWIMSYFKLEVSLGEGLTLCETLMVGPAGINLLMISLNLSW